MEKIKDRFIKLKKWYLNLELFNIFISNPLETWWKARKYFKMPKPELHFFADTFYNCPFARYDYNGRLLTIWSTDVWWKDKEGYPVHERDPFIYVCFFRKFGFSINFKVSYIYEDGSKRDGGMYYWEYLVDYLYYRKDICKLDYWSTESKIFKERDYKTNKVYFGKIYIPTHLFSLNKTGMKIFQEGIKSKKLIEDSDNFDL